MYKNSATREHPGLMIYLVDQSGSMVQESKANNFPLAKNVADSINYVLSELIEMCTKPKGEEETEVRDYFKIVIIGYGGEAGYKATVIESLKISELADKFSTEMCDTVFGKVLIRNIVKPIAGYVTPMSEAFAEAKKEIRKWIDKGHNGSEDPAPIIINITDGAPTDIEGYATPEAIEKTGKEVAEILAMGVPDGKPRIFNIMVSQIDANQFKFPNNNTDFGEDDFAKFLFAISSDVDEFTKDLIIDNGLGNPTENSKFLMINVNDPASMIKFIKIGTPVKRKMR